jgi:hypothetical protein
VSLRKEHNQMEQNTKQSNNQTQLNTLNEKSEDTLDEKSKDQPQDHNQMINTKELWIDISRAIIHVMSLSRKENRYYIGSLQEISNMNGQSQNVRPTKSIRIRVFDQNKISFSVLLLFLFCVQNIFAIAFGSVFFYSICSKNLQLWLMFYGSFSLVIFFVEIIMIVRTSDRSSSRNFFEFFLGTWKLCFFGFIILGSFWSFPLLSNDTDQCDVKIVYTVITILSTYYLTNFLAFIYLCLPLLFTSCTLFVCFFR